MLFYLFDVKKSDNTIRMSCIDAKYCHMDRYVIAHNRHALLTTLKKVIIAWKFVCSRHNMK